MINEMKNNFYNNNLESNMDILQQKKIPGENVFNDDVVVTKYSKHTYK